MVGKAYADWVTRAPELKGASQFIQDPPSLYAAGIEPVFVPTRLPPSGAHGAGRTIAVKNSVDVKMTADCIDTAHSFPNIKTFVLVSGDSDFIHVINSLRSVGKRVLVVGVSWATSRRIADHVDGLIFYDSDVDPIDLEPAPHRGFNQRARQFTPSHQLTNPGRHQLPEVIRAIEDVIRSERAAGHTLLLTSLKQRLVRRISGFDERKLGFSGFKKLMLRVAAEGNIKIRSVDLVDWVLMADEPDPIPQLRDEDDAINSYAENEPSAVVAGSVDAAAEAAASEADADAPDVADEPESVAVPSPQRMPAAPEPDRLSDALSDAVADLDLPASDDNSGDVARVADLIVMGHTLEERDGADSLMFTALRDEITQALAAGIEVEDPTVVAHWGENSSRTFVSRLIRSLESNGVFQHRRVSVRDPETKHVRRKNVFGLNRRHPLTGIALAARLGLPYQPVEANLGTNDAIATPPLDEHGSAEASNPDSADEAEPLVALT